MTRSPADTQQRHRENIGHPLPHSQPPIWSPICTLDALSPASKSPQPGQRKAVTVAVAVAPPAIALVHSTICAELLPVYYRENLVLSTISTSYTVSAVFHLETLALWMNIRMETEWWAWVREVRVKTAGELMEYMFVRTLEGALREKGVGVSR